MLDLHLYEIKIISVVDGDTVKISGLDHGFGLWGFKTRGKTTTGRPIHYSIRIAGINTPETRRGWWSKTLSESEISSEIKKGKYAKWYLNDLWESSEKAYLRSHLAGADNFGRLLGDVILLMKDGTMVDVGARMIELKLAEPFKK